MRETVKAATGGSTSLRDLDGRRFIITGPYSGIGRVTARNLASRGAALVLAGRSIERCQALAAELRAAGRAGSHRGAGAGSRRSRVGAGRGGAGDRARRAHRRSHQQRRRRRLARASRATVSSWRSGSITWGISCSRGCSRRGCARALPRAWSTSPAKPTAASPASTSKRCARPTKTRTGLHEYGVSKLCNILFTREIARRWAGSGIIAYALHPGVIATDIWRSVPQPLRWLLTRWMKTPEAGAATSIRCATDPALANVNGRYFINEREVNPNRAARDDGLAARLWDESER